jgi:exodeoxyribonuclease VII small subunit
MSRRSTEEAGTSPQEAAAEPSFGATLRELEAILDRIEGEQIDIDQLAAELKRATALVELARGKIRKAEVEVAQIVQTLEKPEAE